MKKLPTAQMTRDLLNYLFLEFDIWNKISNGCLDSRPIGRVPSKSWTEATSMILKHFLPNGKHLATTHCVKDNKNGSTLHWDVKDLVISDIRVWTSESPHRGQ